MDSKVVDPTSVQSQFVNLNRDRENLRNIANNAERERRQEEALTQTLRETQRSLTERLRMAHAALGAENEKRKLLVEEQSRLKRVMQEDKKAIIDLNAQLSGMVEAQKNRKKNFVREMTLLNDELDRYLKNNEEMKMKKYITVNNVQFLLDNRVNDEMSREQELLSRQSGAEESQESAQSGKWTSFNNKLSRSLDLLRDATLKLDCEQQNKKRLEQERQLLRAKMMKEGHAIDNSGQPLGEMELNELERLWDASESEAEVGTDAKHMDMERSENVNQDDEVNDRRHYEGHQQSKKDDQQQPINMELFYGNDNCENVNNSDINFMTRDSMQSSYTEEATLF